MDLSKKAVLAFLEEDNEQKAFFRLIPLMDQDGGVREEALVLWPDEGGLRIVPDRNEQYHFKDRMRALGAYCLMDLTAFPPEANKVRTNKNYHPEKGEVNQYIVYSDCIRPLPEDACYQVVEAETPEQLASALQSFVTPKGYVLCQGSYYGPALKGGAAGEPAQLDPKKIYPVTCPDGLERRFCWNPGQYCRPLKDRADGRSEKMEAAIEIGRPLKILDQSLAFEDQLQTIAQPLPQSANLLTSSKAARPAPQPAAALSGTPLFQAAGSRRGSPRMRNPLHEVVEAQWRAARYEAPSAQLQQGADLRHVENPVEKCREAMTFAWTVEETQQQIVNDILSLPGMARKLEKTMHRDAEESAIAGAVRRQLQEMEAERLSLLVQLDKARADIAAFREETLAAAGREKRRELEDASQELEKARAETELVKQQLNSLTAQREALEKEIDQLHLGELPQAVEQAAFRLGLCMFSGSVPARLTAKSGRAYSKEEMIAKMQNAFSICHAPVSQEEAVNWVVLLAVCPRIQVSHAVLGSGLRFVETACRALGGTAVCLETDKQAVCAQAQPSPGLAVVAAPYLLPPVAGAKTVLLSNTPSAYLDSAAYAVAPWPVVVCRGDVPAQYPQMGEEPLAVSLCAMESLWAQAEPAGSYAGAWMGQIRSACRESNVELPVQLWEGMARYLAAAGDMMQGGIAAACDYAMAQWLIPAAMRLPKLTAVLVPLAAGLPRSEKLLGDMED